MWLKPEKLHLIVRAEQLVSPAEHLRITLSCQRGGFSSRLCWSHVSEYSLVRFSCNLLLEFDI